MSTQYEQITELTGALLARRWPNRKAAHTWLFRRGVKLGEPRNILGCQLVPSTDGVRLDPVTDEAVHLTEKMAEQQNEAEEAARAIEQRGTEAEARLAEALPGEPLFKTDEQAQRAMDAVFGPVEPEGAVIGVADDGVLTHMEVWTPPEHPEMEGLREELAADPHVTIGAAVQRDRMAELAAVPDVPPDFAKEPDMVRKSPRKGRAVRVSPSVGEALTQIKTAMPTDPTNGAKCKAVDLVIGDLPGESSAYTWACELARKLGKTIMIFSIEDNNLVATVDRAHLAERKAALAAMRTASRPATGGSAGRGKQTEPQGKSAIMARLCMRPDGADAEELSRETGWKLKGPWNSDLRTLAGRFGYGYEVREVEGKRRFFMTPKAEAEGEAGHA